MRTLHESGIFEGCKISEGVKIGGGVVLLYDLRGIFPELEFRAVAGLLTHAMATTTLSGLI